MELKCKNCDCKVDSASELFDFLPEGGKTASDYVKLCKNCYIAERRKRLLSKFPELPKLNGTEKQIKYATDLIVKYFEKDAHYGNNTDYPASLQISPEERTTDYPQHIRKIWDLYENLPDAEKISAKKSTLERIDLKLNKYHLVTDALDRALAILFINNAGKIINIFKYQY